MELLCIALMDVNKGRKQDMEVLRLFYLNN